MNKEKKQKLLAIRLTPELHAKAKSYAYANSMTLQDLIIKLLSKEMGI